MSRQCKDGDDFRHSSYDDYDHSDEELYVYDQCCRNCRYFEKDICKHPGGWTLNNRGLCARFKRKQK